MDLPEEAEGHPKPSVAPWVRLVGLVAGVVLLIYPVILYFILRYWDMRAAVFLLLLLVGLRLLRARKGNTAGAAPASAGGKWILVVQVLGIVAISLLATLWRDPRFLQQLPALISFFLLVTFLLTLFRPPPIIERYARMIDPDLSPAEKTHCKVVTWIWVLFFATNILIIQLLILFATLELWAIYAGGVSYLLMGFLFAGEYLVRKYRFGRLGDGLLDRVLFRLFSRRGHNP